MSKKEGRLNMSDLPEESRGLEEEAGQVKGGALFEPTIERLDNPTTATGMTPTKTKSLIGTNGVTDSKTLDVNLGTFGVTDPKL